MISAQYGHFLLSPEAILALSSFATFGSDTKAAIIPIKGLSNRHKRKNPMAERPLCFAITPPIIEKIIQLAMMAISISLSSFTPNIIIHRNS